MITWAGNEYKSQGQGERQTSRKAPHSQLSSRVGVTTGNRNGRKMLPAAIQVQHHPPGNKCSSFPCPLGFLLVPEQEQSQPQHVDFSTDTEFVQEVAVAP